MKARIDSRGRVGFRRRIDRILRDRDSGAAQIAADVARAMAEAADLGYTESQLRRLRERFLRAHPAMGSVWNAAHAEDPRRFNATLRRHIKDTVKLARRVLPKTGTALTLSYSSSVVAVLGHKGRSVIVAESLPGGEGVRAARALRRHRVRCRVIPDTALAAAAREAAFGVVGADAVTPSHVVNKVGSHLLALACQAAQIPFFVVADSSKLTPEDWPLPKFDEKQLFEAVPRALVTQVIGDWL